MVDSFNIIHQYTNLFTRKNYFQTPGAGGRGGRINGHNRGGGNGHNGNGRNNGEGGHDNFSAMDVIDTSLRSGGSREKLNPKNQYDEEQVENVQLSQ